MTESTRVDEIASVRRRLHERGPAAAALEGVAGALRDAAAHITASFRRGGKLLIFGNGGSAAQAQHLAAEFVGCLSRRRDPLPALALAADGIMVTSLANDFGFASVFARQVDALGMSGDVAVAISTSGASPNALRGAAAARARGLGTVGLIGTPRSEMHGLVDVPIVTPGLNPARVQEHQVIACHLLCEMVEDALFPQAGGDGEADDRSVVLRERLG